MRFRAYFTVWAASLVAGFSAQMHDWGLVVFLGGAVVLICADEICEVIKGKR